MILEAVVEIPYGSRYKYEIDKVRGFLKVDRPLYSPLPYNYGYFPNTLCEDGDALDVCILGCNPVQPLAVVKLEILGVLICVDNGVNDDKIIAKIQDDYVYGENVLMNQVRDFLSTYKTGFVVEGYYGPDRAMDIYNKSVVAYNKGQL